MSTLLNFDLGHNCICREFTPLKGKNKVSGTKNVFNALYYCFLDNKLDPSDI